MSLLIVDFVKHVNSHCQLSWSTVQDVLIVLFVTLGIEIQLLFSPFVHITSQLSADVHHLCTLVRKLVNKFVKSDIKRQRSLIGSLVCCI